MPEVALDIPKAHVEVTVGSERIDYELLGGALHVHPFMMVLLDDSPWLVWLRESLDLPELFEYRHRWTGNFILAGWLPSGIMCQELWNYDDRRPWWPGGDERPTTQLGFLSRLNRSTAERAAQRVEVMRESMARERSERNQDNQEKKEQSKFVRLKGMTQEALDILEGRTPWAGTHAGGDTLSRIKDELKSRLMVIDMGGRKP